MDALVDALARLSECDVARDWFFLSLFSVIGLKRLFQTDPPVSLMSVILALLVSWTMSRCLRTGFAGALDRALPPSPPASDPTELVDLLRATVGGDGIGALFSTVSTIAGYEPTS